MSVTVTQLEHAPTLYSDPLPGGDLFDRLGDLLRERRVAMAAVTNSQFWVEVYDKHPNACSAERRAQFVNRLTQSALRVADIEREIVEVARLVVAENDNAEMITI